MKSPTRLAVYFNLKATSGAVQAITVMADMISPRRWPRPRSPVPAEVKRDKGAGSINYAADYVMNALNDTVGAIDEDISWS